jgi:hypothetical protein
MKTTILLTLVLISLNFTAQIPSYIPSNGLVGWWPFNGNANDESGNGNNGTVIGSILSSDRNGNANNAYSFNGINNYIDLGNPITLGNNPTSFTQAGWAYFNDFNDGYVFISKRHDNSGNDWATPVTTLNNTFIFFADDAFYQNAPMAESNGLLVNQWYHLTCVKSSDVYSIYVNGLLVSSITDSHQMGGSTNNLIIGAQLAWPEFMKGSLDDIGIWNRALTDQEILALYQGCQMVITTQPSNQSVNVSAGNATFSVASSGSNPTYQWQTNLGLGFQSLSNAGQYNGVNTANLSVSNLNTSNDNQTFRCMINDNGCVDTSYIATLTIIDDASVFEDNAISILISPNPITNQFFISGIEQVVSMILMDMNGKIVKTLNEKEKSHDVSNLKPGMYFLEVRDENRTYMIKVMKD